MAKTNASIAAKTGQHGPRLSLTVALIWRNFCRDAFDGYRPELHYMRGPGPKWRAKHGISVPAPVTTAARPATASA